MNWYPKNRRSTIIPATLDNTPVISKEETREIFRIKKDHRKPCPVCIQGMRKDAKTGKIRDCVLCGASGFIKPKKS